MAQAGLEFLEILLLTPEGQYCRCETGERLSVAVSAYDESSSHCGSPHSTNRPLQLLTDPTHLLCLINPTQSCDLHLKLGVSFPQTLPLAVSCPTHLLWCTLCALRASVPSLGTSVKFCNCNLKPQVQRQRHSARALDSGVLSTFRSPPSAWSPASSVCLC